MISRRVNSGHPLFIGYGRTGADSPMDHQKTQSTKVGWVFCYSLWHNLTPWVRTPFLVSRVVNQPNHNIKSVRYFLTLLWVYLSR